ncbi:MAG TPA: ATP-binding protein, partial [Burkholderiaceae bacterium]|nr:ATP-binding protein [Burkholderiaceae bacterium]
GSSASAEASAAVNSSASAPRAIEVPPAFARIFRAFVLARGLVGLLLVLMQGLLALLTSDSPSLLAQLICTAYAGVGLVTLIWTARHGPPLDVPNGPGGALGPRWWLITVGVDLLAFGLLLFVGTVGLNVAALFVLPVLMSATLMERRPALAVSAGVVLLLLAHALIQGPGAAEFAPQLAQAGLTGAGMLAIAALTSELADRLARQEMAARSTLELARQQARLNRLMIEEMPDGVMVVDRNGRVRAANPAAIALIGAERQRRFVPFELGDQPGWKALLLALQQGFDTGTWPQAGQELSLQPPAAAGAPAEERQLRVRMRFTRRQRARETEELGVLFLEDMRMLRARAQQEKLAAMGRVSAGIAHEIRNPLAAIAQANALLAEDLTEPGAARLAQMVADNVRRLQRIVDDVLEVVPGAPLQAPVIDLGLQVEALCAEWARTAGLSASAASPLQVDGGSEPLAVRFDPEHLRRVLINLLDNALRHGSGQPQAVWVRVAALGPHQVSLSVASDGRPIAPDVEPYLFEPFFSTRSRGSGLGLYICRELCERYGGSIEYQPRGAGARHRNAFIVTLPRLADATPRSRLI